VSKVLADMHVPPAVARWGARIGLAMVVAIAIGYAPGHVLRRDARTVKLEAQLDELAVEAEQLRQHNATLVRSIEAMRTSVGAVEDRARADLGMVYPNEIILRVRPSENAP
jgi:cell division protein FtsB